MDRFRIISQLGAGGFGEAFRAWDTQHSVPVVLKRPLAKHLQRPDVLERFDREINRLRELTHPHVVPIIAHGHDSNGLPYLAMRFLPAGSLADRKKPQPFSFLHRWLPSVAAALDYVHARGVVHRDVKPANIFFDTDSRAYLGDFGIAKVIDEDLAAESEHSLTSTGGEIGTYPYMGPEYFRKPRILTGAYDQYALAVTVYEMVCGRRPFSGDSGQLILAHATQEPPDLRSFRSDAPLSLCEALARALAKAPGDRFHTCTAFAEAGLACIPATIVDKNYRRFLCPGCHKLMRVPSDFGDRNCRCPACGIDLRVSRSCDALWRGDETPSTHTGNTRERNLPSSRCATVVEAPPSTNPACRTILIPADNCADLIPESLARHFTVFPLSKSRTAMLVASGAEANELDRQELMRRANNHDITMLPAPTNAVIEAIDVFYRNAPINRLINRILLEAIEFHASEVFLRSVDEEVLIQYRIRGELIDRDRPPRRLLGAMLSRIKMLFGLVPFNAQDWDPSDLPRVSHRQPREATVLAICSDGQQRDLYARIVSEGNSAMVRLMPPRER